MPLSEDTLKQIETQVRGGFEDRESIIEILCEEVYEPGELDAAEVAAAVDRAMATHEAAKANWPKVTDCDKLERVFDALNQRGIIALQNAGYTQSDGYDDFREVLGSVPDPKQIIGYCFYHGQDLERAVAGGGLYLAFGPREPRDEHTKGPAVGRMIVEEFRRAGFQVTWDGTFAERIYISPFDWKRR
jgi:hypothetical protein